ncbi:hypothetical protein OTK59_23740 [Vibrio natriegens]|uniref:hypothetical protein n=1 Tax=Vibrio natriegens TaxID=691 RepID=UPI0022835A83|nr:hypothetical protein [Vibrio natriegens]MCY9879559.1 hypothetical protein [Vibrio natriegens]
MGKVYAYYRCEWNSDEKLPIIFRRAIYDASELDKKLLLFINKKSDTSSLEKVLSKNKFNYNHKSKTAEQIINKLIEERSLIDESTKVKISLESCKTLSKYEDDFDIILALFPSSDMLNQLSNLQNFNVVICIGYGEHLDKWITKHNANPVVFNN